MLIDLPYKFRLIILCFIAFVATMLVFKPILKIAMDKNIVDNPEARKLQKIPIPVMGGIAVFFGIAVGLCFYKTMILYTILFPVVGAMIIMLYLGAIDDIISIKPTVRLAVELGVALMLIYGLNCCITDFQGLWGIDNVSKPVGILLSILTFLGVVNAINMIDGIDGLSSAFCIMIMGMFGIFCFFSGYFSFAVLSAVMIGALIPFFLHNVFGYTTKMFIGDAGTLMAGTAISAMVFVILKENNAIETRSPEIDFSRIAFCIATLAIPVADTLRVMFFRIIHHKSPFHPDKNHLHHIFIEAGFSYIWTTIIEISLNILIIAAFFLSWKLGASVDVQLYVVVGLTAMIDFGIAKFLPKVSKARIVNTLADKSHVERVGFWRVIQRIIDGE